MDELDELRKEKLSRMQDRQAEEQQLAKQIEQLENMVRPAMSRDH